MPRVGTEHDDSLPRLRLVVASEGKYSIAVFGLAADGTPEPPRPPSPTPEPIVIVPVGTVTPICEWECILRSVGWPSYAIADALRISRCESEWLDVQNKDGGPYWGRFQIAFTDAGYHQDKLIALGYPPTTQALLDPYINARVALLIWQEQGWTPWECK